MTNKDETLKKGVKQDTGFRKGQAHSCGSVLQFLITVIGDWLSLLHFKQFPRRQTSKLNTYSTLGTTLSFLQLTLHLLPSHASATLLPAFQLLHSHQSSGGGETVYNRTLCGVVSYTARWGQTDTATSWRWDPAPCWRWTGLLHLLWEADWRSEEGVRRRR